MENTQNTEAKARQPRVFGTKEWANKNVNCLSGCSHDCHYCYAKAGAIRFKRKTPTNWKEEVFVGTKTVGGKPCRVMFPNRENSDGISFDGCHYELVRKYNLSFISAGLRLAPAIFSNTFVIAVKLHNFVFRQPGCMHFVARMDDHFYDIRAEAHITQAVQL